MAQPVTPAPAAKPARNWTPILIIGGCGCLLLLCVCVLAVVAYGISQNWFQTGTQFGTPTPAAIQVPSSGLSTPSQLPPAVGGTAQPLPAAGATPTAFPGLVKVVLATSTQGDNKDPLGATDTFAPTQKIFHAVVSVADLPDNTPVRAVWYVVDIGDPSQANSKIDEFTLPASGTRNLDFTLSVGPSGKWPEGSYKVEIYINGVLARTVPFRVHL